MLYTYRWLTFCKSLLVSHDIYVLFALHKPQVTAYLTGIFTFLLFGLLPTGMSRVDVEFGGLKYRQFLVRAVLSGILCYFSLDFPFLFLLSSFILHFYNIYGKNAAKIAFMSFKIHTLNADSLLLKVYPFSQNSKK